MRKTSFIMVAVLVATLLFFNLSSLASPELHSAAVIDPVLAKIMSSQSPNQSVSVIVILNNQVDVRSLGGRDRAERQRNVINALHAKADATQVDLRALLKTRQSEGQVETFTPLWIINAVAVRANRSVIEELSRLPEVRSIVPDAIIQAPAPPSTNATTTITPEANISRINAPAVWNLGFQGQGVVIANMDTGVDYTHPDLSAQWRGGSDSWFDPYGQHSVPTDVNGHGTWTMGVMIGRDAGGTSIGVAPDAKWIAVKIFDDRGAATSSAIHQGYQWLLDPDNNPLTSDAPNIVNNSWDFNSWGCHLDFEPDLQSLVAAGITPVFSAGNYGPNSSTSASPANNPDAFSVGATDNTDVIASFSSRGPNACNTNVTFPAVVAPGVNVKTTDLYGLYTSVSGTSFSAPHVSGALALLLSAFPNLTVSQQEIALTSTAFDLGSVGLDNTYGAGRIDVLAAYNAVLNGNLPTPTPTATATPTATPKPTATPTNTPTPTAIATATATPAVTAAPTPTTDTIFADGFESGNLNVWSAATTGGGRLSVTTNAALIGAWGMQALINNTSPLYVTDRSPNAEAGYHARFYFSPNGVAPSNTNPQDIVVGRSAAGTSIFRVQFRRSSGSYQVRGLILANSGLNQTTSWYTISNASHAIEIAWQASASGSLSLWIDGTLKETRSGVANGNYRLEEIRLGPSSGIASGTTGTEYFDAFVSTRNTYIGP